MSFACQAKKAGLAPYNISYLSSSSANNWTIVGAQLAVNHINQQGGLRGGRPIALPVINYPALSQTADQAFSKVIQDGSLAVIVTTSSEAYAFDPASGASAGASLAAARLKAPLFLVGGTAPAFAWNSVQAELGAVYDGLDTTCATTPLTCDTMSGTLVSTGYTYRTIGPNSDQVPLFANMIAGDHHSVVALMRADPQGGADLYSLGFEDLVSQAITAQGGILVRTTDFDTTSQDTMNANFAEASADSPSNGPIDAIIVLGAYSGLELLGPAVVGSSVKPQVYASSLFHIGPQIQATGASDMLGFKGVFQPAARGPGAGTARADLAAAEGIPAEDIDLGIYDDNDYDAVILIALAIYATGVEDPTPAEVKAKLDTLNDPKGVHIGYKQLALAKSTLDSGGTINYDGVASDCDFDAWNGVHTPLWQWQVVQVAGGGVNFQDSAIP